MATDYWVSSHNKRWIVDRATLLQARAEDRQYVDDPDYISLLSILCANIISKICSKLQLRQRVIATASVFFRRFYLKNSYCETDPYLVLASCCYVAAKAEEMPVHIRTIIAETRALLSNEYNIRYFPSEHTKFAEMEFYLVDDLECDLVVFHPYRTLLALVKDASNTVQEEEREAGEVGVGLDDGPRYWGSGEGRLILNSAAIQNAWFLINDTYRSDICLLYPPHLIAIAALYLTCFMNPVVRQAHVEWVEKQEQEKLAEAAAAAHNPHATRRSLRHASSTTSKNGTDADDTVARKQEVPPQDLPGFFAALNVNLRVVVDIVREMISFYDLYNRLKEETVPGTAGISATTGQTQSAQGHAHFTRSQPMQPPSTSGRGSSASPNFVDLTKDDDGPLEIGGKVDSAFLVQMHARMRAMREADLANPAPARPVIVNKLFDQASGG